MHERTGAKRAWMRGKSPSEGLWSFASLRVEKEMPWEKVGRLEARRSKSQTRWRFCLVARVFWRERKISQCSTHEYSFPVRAQKHTHLAVKHLILCFILSTLQLQHLFDAVEMNHCRCRREPLSPSTWAIVAVDMSSFCVKCKCSLAFFFLYLFFLFAFFFFFFLSFFSEVTGTSSFFCHVPCHQF